MVMAPIHAISIPFLPEPQPQAGRPGAAATVGAYQADQFELSFANDLGFGSAPAATAPQPIGTNFLGWLRQKTSQLIEGMRNPLSFFITQYKSSFNTNEDVAGNGNCGPASLTMVAMAFGKAHVSPAQANDAIERTRKSMTGKNNEMAGTSFGQLAQGAASYGLQSREVKGNLATLQAELANGRLPIALISPREFRNSTSRGHYVVVTKIDERGVHCNDPAIRKGPIVISHADFMKGWSARGAKAIAIGP